MVSGAFDAIEKPVNKVSSSVSEILVKENSLVFRNPNLPSPNSLRLKYIWTKFRIAQSFVSGAYGDNERCETTPVNRILYDCVIYNIKILHSFVSGAFGYRGIGERQLVQRTLTQVIILVDRFNDSINKYLLVNSRLKHQDFLTKHIKGSTPIFSSFFFIINKKITIFHSSPWYY